MSAKTVLRAAYLLCALLIAAAVPAVAEDAPAGAMPAQDAFLSQFLGRWNVVGTYKGQPAKHKFKGEWTIQNNYLRFRDVSEEENAAGVELFEVISYIGYDAAKGRYVCVWLDNSGVADPESVAGTATRVGDTLPFVFKTAKGTFHATFAYDAKANKWLLTMENETGGTVQPIAKLQLNKAR
jgi:hypothetical protein